MTAIFIQGIKVTGLWGNMVKGITVVEVHMAYRRYHHASCLGTEYGLCTVCCQAIRGIEHEKHMFVVLSMNARHHAQQTDENTYFLHQIFNHYRF